MPELIGVRYLPQVSARKPWRACINRCNRSYYIGLYKSSQEACRAYDNAANYLKPWSSGRSVIPLNFPGEWEKEIPAPNKRTIYLRDRLRKSHPEKEIEAAGKKNINTGEELEHSMLALLDTVQSCTDVLRKRVTDSIGRVKMMEARIADLIEDVAKRERIIDGLRAQGGQQFFKLVTGKAPEQITAVENHLDEGWILPTKPLFPAPVAEPAGDDPTNE